MDLSFPVIAVAELGRLLSDAFCGLCNVKLSAMIVCSQRVSDMSIVIASLSDRVAQFSVVSLWVLLLLISRP